MLSCFVNKFVFILICCLARIRRVDTNPTTSCSCNSQTEPPPKFTTQCSDDGDFRPEWLNETCPTMDTSFATEGLRFKLKDLKELIKITLAKSKSNNDKWSTKCLENAFDGQHHQNGHHHHRHQKFAKLLSQFAKMATFIHRLKQCNIFESRPDAHVPTKLFNEEYYQAEFELRQARCYLFNLAGAPSDHSYFRDAIVDWNHHCHCRYDDEIPSREIQLFKKFELLVDQATAEVSPYPRSF